MMNSVKERTSFISEESLEFLTESSTFGFFKHDIKRGTFSFDNILMSNMGISSDDSDVPEHSVILAWGENLYGQYIQTVNNNLKFRNYKYVYNIDSVSNDNIAYSKIHVVLFLDDKGDLAFVEGIFTDPIVERESNNTSSLFSDNQFREILNNINSLVFVVDTNYNIVDCNNEGQKIFSISNHNNKLAIPLNKHFAFPLEDVEMVLRTGKPLLGYKTPFVAETISARNFIFNVAKIVLQDHSSYLVFSGIDISETLVLEDQLIVNELKFKSLVDQSPLGINIYDTHAALLDTNLAAMGILEISSKKDLLGTHMYECYDLSKEEIAKLERGEVLSFSGSFDFGDINRRFAFKSNYQGIKYLEVILLKLHSTRVDSGLGYMEFISDKTSEHDVLESLKKSSNQLTLATSTGNVGIFEINLLDRTYAANSETILMFEDQSLNSNSGLDDFYKLIYADDLMLMMTELDSLKKGLFNSFSVEYRIKLNHNKCKWIKTTVSVSARDDGGKPIRVSGINIDIDDLKKAKEEAIKRENLLKQTLNIGEIGLWEYNAEKDVISLDSSLEHSLHSTYSTFGGRDFSSEEFFSIIDSKDRDFIMVGYKSIFDGKKDFLTSQCRLNDSYDNIWVSLTAFVNERDSVGKPLRMNGSVMNIDEKASALEEAKRMEYLITTSLEIAKVGYLYKDYDSDVIDISDSCCEIYAMDKKGISDIDYFVKERIHPKDRRKYLQYAKGFREKNSSKLKDINYRVIIDGEVRRFHAFVTLRFDDKNRRIGTLYAFQDVTDLYDKETRLQELLDSQRAVAEISVMMMSVVDPAEMLEKLLLNVKSRMKATNISYYKKNDDSYTLKKSIGTATYKIHNNEDDDIREGDVEYIINKIKYNTPVLLGSSDDFKSDHPSIEDRFFMPKNSSLFLPIIVRNALYGFLVLNIDKRLAMVSHDHYSLINSFIQIVNLAFEKLHNHIELLDAKNRAEEADRLKTAFLANMSHEIRTPLNSVVGFSQLIAESAKDDEDEVSQYVTVLNRNTDQLLSTVNNVIDFSEIESSSLFIKPKLASVEKMFDEICESCILRYKGNVKVICTKPPGDEVFLNSDLLRVKQIFQNIICNAFKYTTEGSVEYGYEPKDDGVLFYVFDTGEGIKDEYKEKIFERFFQIDPMAAGTGLGLSIVKALVDKLGGDLCFESNEGEGLKFYVYIPNSKE